MNIVPLLNSITPERPGRYNNLPELLASGGVALYTVAFGKGHRTIAVRDPSGQRRAADVSYHFASLVPKEEFAKAMADTLARVEHLIVLDDVNTEGVSHLLLWGKQNRWGGTECDPPTIPFPATELRH